jgi:TP901 family phage tail tape measure protein
MAGIPLGAVKFVVLPDMAAFAPAVRTGIARTGFAGEGKKAGSAFAGGLKGALSSAKGLLAVAGIGGLAIGIKDAVGAAVTFQSQMEKIRTQAGASQADVSKLSSAILSLKGAQQGPNELAAAMFHLKSVGLDNANALKALKAASDLAAVGGANLEDTTNAIAGAWRSGVKGAQSFGQAAATVNAIVGAGNVKMQDLVDAIGTGILPSARAFGVSFRSVGAALALMTDEGIPAVNAATRLRMSLSLLGAPSAAAEKQLQSIGLTGLKLANDLRSPGGIVTAISDLKSHLESAGLSASQQAQVLSRAFGGGRSSSAILTLVNNLEVLRRKQVQVNDGISKFGDDVAAQKQTAEAQFHILQANVETLGVSIGNLLLPVAVGFSNLLRTTLVPALGFLAKALTGAGAGSKILRDSLVAIAGTFAAVKTINLIGAGVTALTAKWAKLALIFRSTRDAQAAGQGISGLAKTVGALVSKQGLAAGGSAALGGAIGGLSLSAVAGGAAVAGLAAGLGVYIYSTRNSITATQQISRQLDAQRAKLGFDEEGYYRLGRQIGQMAQAQVGATVQAGRYDSAVQSNIDKQQAYTREQQQTLTAGHRLSSFLTVLQDAYGVTRQQAIDLAVASGTSAKALTGAGKSAQDARDKVVRYANANLGLISPISTVNRDLGIYSNKALSAKDRTQALSAALSKLLDPLQSNDQNVINLYNDIDTLKTNLNNSAGKTGLLTQKQRDSRAQFEAVITDTKQLLTQTGLSSKQIENNRQRVLDLIPKLREWAGHNKTLRQEVNDLAAALRNVPKQTNSNVNVHADGQWSPGTLSQIRDVANVKAGIHFRSRGGRLPGYGGGDRNLTMLEDGEAVVSKETTRRYAGTLKAMGVPGMQAGGLVGMPSFIGSRYDHTIHNADAALASVAAAEMRRLTAALHQLTASLSGGYPGGGASGPGAAAAQRYAASILHLYGWGQNQMPPLISLWNGESGWNYKAYNASSGATGIPQSLPGSKMAAAGPDWRTNPATQIRWGLGYIRDTYGSPANAYAKWLSRSPHWYGNGGWITEPIAGVGLRTGKRYGFGERGDEHVTPAGRRNRSGTAGNVGMYVAGDLVVADQAQAELVAQRNSFALSNAADRAGF